MHTISVRLLPSLCCSQESRPPFAVQNTTRKGGFRGSTSFGGGRLREEEGREKGRELQPSLLPSSLPPSSSSKTTSRLVVYCAGEAEEEEEEAMVHTVVFRIKALPDKGSESGQHLVEDLLAGTLNPKPKTLNPKPKP